MIQLSALFGQHLAMLLILLGVFAISVVVFLFWRPLLMGLGAFFAISAAAHYADTENIVMTNEVNVSARANDFQDGPAYQSTHDFLEQELGFEDETDVEWAEDIKKYPPRNLTEDLREFRPASQVSLIDTDNEEYKARRAKVLKRSDAVVMQQTFR